MIAIGVSGHRVLAEPERIEAAVDTVARRLESAFPGAPWTVVSSLAEGADRLVAGRLLARPGSRLVVVLPLPAADYETGFADAASRAEFRSLVARAGEVVEVEPSRERDAAYDAAGRAIVERSDVLVAVWDGLDPQGRGGTGAVVARARARSLPVAWIHAGNRRPGTLEPTSLGAEQGEVTFERLP